MTLALRAVAAVARSVLPYAGRRTVPLLRLGAARLGMAGRADRALVQEARRRHAAGHDASGAAMLRPLAGRPPSTVSTALQAADVLCEAGEPATAVRLCTTLLQRPDLPRGRRPQVQASLAVAQERNGDLDAAIEGLAAALSARPDRVAWRQRLAQWQFDRGRHLASAGRWEAAAVAYQAALSHDEHRPAWRARFRDAQERGPQWVFHAPGPARIRSPAELAGAQARGLVAPPSRDVAVVGWIPERAGIDRRVLFTLNGTVVADSLAARQVTLPDGRPYWEFRRRLRQLWAYAGAGDLLEIIHEGRPLPIIDNGAQYGFTGRKRRADELIRSLQDGYVLDKYGKLRRSIQVDAAWQSEMMQLFSQLHKELEQEFDLTLVPFYGTMLGAVRDRHFIGHDNDFDTAYISGHSSPGEVRDEFTRVCRHLLERGYSLRVKRTHVWVRVPGTSEKLDIFFAWFDPDGFLQVSYGYHGSPVHRSAGLGELRTEQLGTIEIPVLGCAEAVLAQLYGEGWRVRDPGFRHESATLVLHEEYQLSEDEVNDLYWRQFYRDNRSEGVSRFAEFVALRLPAATTVIEFGCGSGRDSIWFARRGHHVVGTDRSAGAIAQAWDAARAAGVESARFELLDVSVAADVERLLRREVRALSPSRKLAVYLRFFLHSIDQATEQVFLGALFASLPGGTRFCAEFRTTDDEHLPKVHGEHYRRYVDVERFIEHLRHRWGLVVEQWEVGQGLSPYQGEDPHLARIIARTPDGEKPSQSWH